MPTPNTKPEPPIDFDTGARGVSYFRKELAAVRSLLPKLLLQHLQLNAGRVITRVHLPTDLPDNFDWGLEPAISTLQWEFAQEKLADFLSRQPDAVVLFDHPFATPQDKWLSIKSVPYVTRGNDVLFVINRDWAAIDRVDLALNEAGAQQELGALGRHRALSATHSGEIEVVVLEEFVSTVDAVLLRAFDAEGYLLWMRDPR